MRFFRFSNSVLACFFLPVLVDLGYAMTVTGYTSEANDRFSSGYPGAPVENTDPSFVGLGLDWGGVGWDDANSKRSFAFVSPSHYLVARHYLSSAAQPGAPSITLFNDGVLSTHSQAIIEDTGFGFFYSGDGDLSLGTLTAPVATAGLPRYAVLDLNDTSPTNTPANYIGISAIVYGRGPDTTYSTRMGITTLSDADEFGILTPRTDLQLEGGDSGSPIVHRWLNPNGGEEITLLGNNFGIDATYNYMNFTGNGDAMSQMNVFMNDEGYALRVAGDPTHTWSGTSDNSIADNASWNIVDPDPAPSDSFVTFDAATAGSGRIVDVDSAHNLRGLYFINTVAASDGFSFNGTETLTLGRGGITNYDNSRQAINADLALASSQYWDGGAGGVTAQNINTNGYLLEMAGVGENRIEGIVSGSGGLANSGDKLTLTGDNSYSGNTWVNTGELAIDGDQSAANGNVRVSAGATLSGSGIIGGSTTISGKLSPGSTSATGTLTYDFSGGEKLTFSAGSTMEFQIGSASDLIDFSSSGDWLVGSGWTADFLTGVGFMYNTAYTVFDNATTASFSPGTFKLNGVTLSPSEYSWQMMGDSYTFTVVPEASNLLVGILLAMGFFGRRDR